MWRAARDCAGEQLALEEQGRQRRREGRELAREGQGRKPGQGPW